MHKVIKTHKEKILFVEIKTYLIMTTSQDIFPIVIQKETFDTRIIQKVNFVIQRNQLTIVFKNVLVVNYINQEGNMLIAIQTTQFVI